LVAWAEEILACRYITFGRPRSNIYTYRMDIICQAYQKSMRSLQSIRHNSKLMLIAASKSGLRRFRWPRLRHAARLAAISHVMASEWKPSISTHVSRSSIDVFPRPMTLTFNRRRAMVMTHTRAKYQGQKLVGTRECKHTDERTDGHDRSLLSIYLFHDS